MFKIQQLQGVEFDWKKLTKDQKLYTLMKVMMSVVELVRIGHVQTGNEGFVPQSTNILLI